MGEKGGKQTKHTMAGHILDIGIVCKSASHKRDATNVHVHIFIHTQINRRKETY